MTGSFEWIELIPGVAGRRRWSVEEKLRMVAESLMPDMPVSAAGAAAWGSSKSHPPTFGAFGGVDRY